MSLKQLFTLWGKYKMISELDASTSPIQVIALHNLLDQVTAIEGLLDYYGKHIVSDCHYGVVHLLDILLTLLSSISDIYDSLLGKSPNNQKLRNGRSTTLEKLSRYVERNNTLLKKYLG